MLAALALTISLAVAPKPHVLWKPIPYGPKRKAEMASYAEKHYGIHSWRLHPKVIVEHYTAAKLLRGVEHLRREHADPELGELPGTCAHFIVDRNGRIYQLVRLNVMCRHTVGLNYVAIGIEHVARPTDRSSTTRPRSAPRSSSRRGSSTASTSASAT